MKKKFIYTFIGIGALVLILYLFRYKQSLTFTNRVPKDATAVININTRQLEHHILVDALKHPFTYLKSSTIQDSIKKEKFSITKGVEIQKNILFYTNTTIYKNNWYSSILTVKDPDELSRYLISEKYQKNKDIYTKGNISFALDKHRLILVILLNKQDGIANTLHTIFNETQFLKDTSSLLKSITQCKSDICFSTKSHDFLEGNFKDGIFEIHGELNHNFDLFLNNIQPEFNTNSIVSIVGKVNKRHPLFKYFLKKTNPKLDKLAHLSLDSIAKSWNGNLSLNLKSIDSEKDTIITYAYDDDFNKTEKMAIQTLTKPNLNFRLGFKENKNILDYLEQQNAIQIIENDTVLIAIPLYKFYASTSNNSLNIYTNKIDVKHPSKNVKFKSFLNLDRYWKSEQKLAFLDNNNSLLQKIRNASVILSSENKLTIIIKSKYENRNFLGQLLKP